MSDEKRPLPKPSTRPVPKYRDFIKGHLYDTETASVIYHWDTDDDDHHFGDNEWLWAEYGLLQNRWGHYFCYYCDSNYEGQRIITPLDRAGAIRWMENHCSWLIEPTFGQIHEAGEGPAYTPKVETIS